MKATISVGLLSALLLLSGTAGAFEVVPTDGGVVTPGPVAKLTPGEPADAGTLVLPELGALEDASKFNFGLELLYGQNAQMAEPELPEGDIGVRGSIRHTF